MLKLIYFRNTRFPKFDDKFISYVRKINKIYETYNIKYIIFLNKNLGFKKPKQFNMFKLKR